jgi:hypothetical protein
MRKSEVLAVLGVAGLLFAAWPVLAAGYGASDDAQAPSADTGSEGKPASEATPGAWSHHGHHSHGHHHHQQGSSDESKSSTSGSSSGASGSSSGGAPPDQNGD